MAQKRPIVLIIIGVTGDLSRRYLLPALGNIAQAGALPEHFHVIGTSRQLLTANELFSDAPPSTHPIRNRIELFQLDPADPESYDNLSQRLDQLDTSLPLPAERLYYLSIPPQVAWPVIESLGRSGLSDQARTKLLLEKPFGVDAVSADTLLTHVERYFTESQVFRIDHYLAKEMAQNLVVFRKANPVFTQTWHKDFIDRIDITIHEQIDIEGRHHFYEQTGALRDVIQSHGLQLAALMLMRLDADMHTVPQRRLEALAKLHVPADDALTAYVRRGQYVGYRDEVGYAASQVETYVDLTLTSTDPDWAGVPIRIETGKALPKKETAVRIIYRDNTHGAPNTLTFKIQPDAGIELELWSKQPGYERRLSRQKLTFSYESSERLPDAYEQVLLDAMAGDHTLFTGGDEVRQSWRILQPIQDYWSLHDEDLLFYDKGSLPDERENKPDHDSAE